MAVWLDLGKQYQQAYRLDRDFYDQIRGARPHYQQAMKFSIPPFSGRGFTVNRGQVFRVIEETGPQIGAVAFWNANDPREGFIAGRTMAAVACFIQPYTRLFSDVPWFRPMATCLEDTVVTEPPGSEFHHHSVGGSCSPETMEMRFGVAGLNACRLNLLQAIEKFGLGEKDLHDTVNVHQKTCLDRKTGRIFVSPGDGRPGDYIEFFAEMDLLVAVSVCPFGDGSADPVMYEAGLVRPLGIEVYDTGTEPKPFPMWTDWRRTWTGRWLPPR